MPTPASVDDVITTSTLDARPERVRDFRFENEVLQELALGLADSGQDLLGRLVTAAVRICGAGSAGLSLHGTSNAGEPVLKWEAVAGEYSQYLGGILPLFSPCGVCIERGRSELFERPERAFTYFSEVRPPIAEALVIPMRGGGKTLGTMWIASHADGPGFTTADLSIMTTLANFTAAALTLLSREDEARDSAARERVAREHVEGTSRIRDEFLSTISHELRTPLHTILSWSELLVEGLPAEDAREAIESIRRNAERQAHLVDDLLDSSRFLSGGMRMEVRPVAMRDIVSAVVQEARPAMEARMLSITVDTGKGSTAVSGDPARLHQALANVIANAVKFSHAGGTVRVETETREHRVIVRVIDTGVGIPPELLPLVFERFTQGDSSTRRRHGGLGLGLAIAREILAAHGGAIDARSAGLGGGATFTLTLPLDPAAAPASDPSAPRLEPGLKGVRILVVDDEPDALEVLVRIFRNRGADVRAASSVDEAITNLTAAPPDVVLTDIGMPHADGYSLLERIRQHDDPRVRATRTIAVTAYSSVDDRERIRVAGFDALVIKPVPAADLVRTMSEILDRTSP